MVNRDNINDGRNFEIAGDYTYTTEKVDPENDTYGMITFTVNSLELEGKDVTFIYLDDDLDSRSYTELGNVLEGWWSYSDNITWGGKMRVWFNWPGRPRGNNFWDGHNELFSGDP